MVYSLRVVGSTKHKVLMPIVSFHFLLITLAVHFFFLSLASYTIDSPPDTRVEIITCLLFANFSRAEKRGVLFIQCVFAMGRLQVNVTSGLS